MFIGSRLAETYLHRANARLKIRFLVTSDPRRSQDGIEESMSPAEKDVETFCEVKEKDKNVPPVKGIQEKKFCVCITTTYVDTC